MVRIVLGFALTLLGLAAAAFAAGGLTPHYVTSAALALAGTGCLCWCAASRWVADVRPVPVARCRRGSR